MAKCGQKLFPEIRAVHVGGSGCCEIDLLVYFRVKAIEEAMKESFGFVLIGTCAVKNSRFCCVTCDNVR